MIQQLKVMILIGFGYSVENSEWLNIIRVYYGIALNVIVRSNLLTCTPTPAPTHVPALAPTQ